MIAIDLLSSFRLTCDGRPVVLPLVQGALVS